MLCGKCLQQGFHAACIAYPALDYKMVGVSDRVSIDTGVGVSGCRDSVGIVSG
jgi:hypothetical protein